MEQMIIFRDFYMALHCAIKDGDESMETYYICRAEQYCCEVDQCCYVNNGYHLPQLWYCWFFVLTGILICSLISGKYCKKRGNVRHVTVTSRMPHHGQQNTIMHPSSVMPNVWAIYPPSYSASNIMVTDASGRPFSQRNDFISSNSSTGPTEGYGNPPNPRPPLPTYPEGAAPGANLSYHTGLGNHYHAPPAPGFPTVIITDAVYDEPPSYESITSSSQHHPHVVSVH
ncbi:uncharacterized protein [Apostichopus japonicus]|uniref:uncharacterized protein isoform X2 n=1 Tax=Stichopus japonicus TaxID=307972 RepID=UPI003AB7C5E8